MALLEAKHSRPLGVPIDERGDFFLVSKAKFEQLVLESQKLRELEISSAAEIAALKK